MSKGTHLGEFEQMVLLAVLREEGEGYGMSIRRELEERAGREVSIGAVYATLDRLEEKGFVRSRDGEATPVRGGRARRHFELTTDGAGALRTARAMMDRLWDGVDLERQGRGA
jgi:DNA-binding PadR family transcriptional regulator